MGEFSNRQIWGETRKWREDRKERWRESYQFVLKVMSRIDFLTLFISDMTWSTSPIWPRQSGVMVPFRFFLNRWHMSTALAAGEAMITSKRQSDLNEACCSLAPRGLLHESMWDESFAYWDAVRFQLTEASSPHVAWGKRYVSIYLSIHLPTPCGVYELHRCGPPSRSWIGSRLDSPQVLNFDTMMRTIKTLPPSRFWNPIALSGSSWGQRCGELAGAECVERLPRIIRPGGSSLSELSIKVTDENPQDNPGMGKKKRRLFWGNDHNCLASCSSG